MNEKKPISTAAPVVLGCLVALAGVAILAVALSGSAERFHAPRWVVGCTGAAFLLLGGWTAALYALGYDPKRPAETLPSPALQLAVLIPGMLFFAAPFHWIALGRGPRHFSATFSLPLLAIRHGTSDLPGRVLFGVGALLIDAILLAAVIRLVRASRPR